MRGYFHITYTAIALSTAIAAAHAGTGYFFGNSDDWSINEHWSDYVAASTCEFDLGRFGTWQAQFDGGGCTKILSVNGVNHLELSPAPIGTGSGTHASLVAQTLFQGNPNLGGDIYLDVKLKTTAQLRTSPNPWEVGWVIWNASFDTGCNCWTFNYFIPKTNGYEFGMVINNGGTQGQVFLATGNSPTFPINTYYDVEIYHSNAAHNGPGNVVEIYVNGTEVVHYTGTNGNPFPSGYAVGLYTEDATVRFRFATATRL